MSVSAAWTGAPTPPARTTTVPPPGPGPTPGGTGNRESGVIVTAVAVFAPTVNEGSTTRVCPAPTATTAVSPTGLTISSEPVAAASTPSIASETMPPPPAVTTGAADTAAGAAGGAYAHATVRTLWCDVPIALTATTSYSRCSPLGAATAGQSPAGEQVATTAPALRTSKPVTAGNARPAAPGSTCRVSVPLP